MTRLGAAYVPLAAGAVHPAVHASWSLTRVAALVTIVGGIVGSAALVVGALSFASTRRQIAHAQQQVWHARVSLDAALAQEVRRLSKEWMRERAFVASTFPIHVDVLRRHPPGGHPPGGVGRWAILGDGKRLETEVSEQMIELLLGRHVSLQMWADVSDLDDATLSTGRRVVGFLNDLCQMLATDTPGQFVFEQFHQLIVIYGTLLCPLISAQQHVGRWGVRVPSLVNRAAIYHETRRACIGTTLYLRRRLAWSEELVPDGLARFRRVEVIIPLVSNRDAVYGGAFPPWVNFPEVEGRRYVVDESAFYSEFRRQIQAWHPPSFVV